MEVHSESSPIPLNNHFQTADTALAAWLHCQGVPLVILEISEGQGMFIFDDPNPELIHAYNSSQAVGNIRLFHHTYRMLLDMYHDAKRAERGQ